MLTGTLLQFAHRWFFGQLVGCLSKIFKVNWSVVHHGNLKICFRAASPDFSPSFCAITMSFLDLLHLWSPLINSENTLHRVPTKKNCSRISFCNLCCNFLLCDRESKLTQGRMVWRVWKLLTAAACLCSRILGWHELYCQGTGVLERLAMELLCWWICLETQGLQTKVDRGSMESLYVSAAFRVLLIVTWSFFWIGI